MVAHLLRLRLDLLIGSFRGGSRHVVRVVVSTLLAVAGVAVAVWAILREHLPVTVSAFEDRTAGVRSAA